MSAATSPTLPASRASFPFPRCTRFIPALGCLHLLFSPPRTFSLRLLSQPAPFISRSQLTCHFPPEAFSDHLIWRCVCAKSLQSCLTLCDPMDCTPPGSSVHGLLQASVLEWVAVLPTGNLPDPGINASSLSLSHHLN